MAAGFFDVIRKAIGWLSSVPQVHTLAPAERTFSVPTESRTYSPVNESRTYSPVLESRTYSVPDDEE